MEKKEIFAGDFACFKLLVQILLLLFTLLLYWMTNYSGTLLSDEVYLI